MIIAINAIRFLPGFIVETKYNSAVELQENKNYSEAITKFEELGDYEDSEKRISSRCFTRLTASISIRARQSLIGWCITL